SIKSRAVLSPDGKHYILNGGKIWISNGGIADIFTVFAQTPVKTESGETKERITAFIVERGFGGVTSGPPEKKMGIKASNTATVNFDDTPVPVENVLGQVGEGFKVCPLRPIRVHQQHIYFLHCAPRNRSRKELCKRQGRDKRLGPPNLREKLPDALVTTVSLPRGPQAMTYMLSGNMDRGFTEYHLEAASTKVTASECAWYVTDESIQIHGGMGFMRDTGLERVQRDLRIFRIFEGANDILRLFVALQGLSQVL
ncbi:medium-chain acyl-CoA dehydrogenase, putative, partial [Ixodes scapularis]